MCTYSKGPTQKSINPTVSPAKLKEIKYVFLLSVVPSQPSEFKGEAKSETSILLSWVAPPQGGPDNQITGYELVYRRADDTEEVRAEVGCMRPH